MNAWVYSIKCTLRRRRVWIFPIWMKLNCSCLLFFSTDLMPHRTQQTLLWSVKQILSVTVAISKSVCYFDTITVFTWITTYLYSIQACNRSNNRNDQVSFYHCWPCIQHGLWLSYQGIWYVITDGWPRYGMWNWLHLNEYQWTFLMITQHWFK